MKKELIFIAALSTLCLSCGKDDLIEKNDEQEPDIIEANLIPMTFLAGSDEGQENNDTESKVILGGENSKLVIWDESDEIKVFDKTKTDLPAFKIEDGIGTTTAKFNGLVTESSNKPYYALYPYQADATYNEEETNIGGNTYQYHLCVTLPHEQKAVANGVDPKAFIAVAQNDEGSVFDFKNLVALVKFQLKEDDIINLNTVSFSGHNQQSLAGKMKVAFSSSGIPEQTYVSDQMFEYISLSKPDNGWQSNTDYFFVIRGATKFENGFTITAQYSDGTCKHIATKKQINDGKTIGRNQILNLKTLPSLKNGLPNDLYIAYLHGLDIPIGNLTINKSDGRIVSLIKNNATVKDGGIVFVNPDATANISNYSNLIIIGRFTGTPSKITKNEYVNIMGTTQTDLFALKNIDLSDIGSSKAYLFALNKTDNFETVIFDNCKINLTKTTLMQVNDKPISEIVIKNCDIKLNNSSSYLINYGTNNKPLTSIEFSNNILYAESDVTSTMIVRASGTPINSISADYNTFINVYCGANGFFYTKETKKYILEKNIFYFPNYKNYSITTNSEGVSSGQYWGVLRCNGTNDLSCYPSEGNASASNNYVYRLKDEGNLVKDFKTSHRDMKKTVDGNTSYYPGVTNPKNDDKNPFSDLNTSILSFTLNSDYVKYGGAQR